MLWINRRAGFCDSPETMLAKEQAPSWSWESTNARTPHLYTPPDSIYYSGSRKNEDLQIFFSVSDTRTDLATDDLTGQVKGGSIMITGSTFEAKFVDTVNSAYSWRAGPGEHCFGLVMSNSGQEIKQQFRSDMETQVKFDFPINPLRCDGEPLVSHGRIKCIRMTRIM